MKYPTPWDWRTFYGAPCFQVCARRMKSKQREQVLEQRVEPVYKIFLFWRYKSHMRKYYAIRTVNTQTRRTLKCERFKTLDEARDSK